MKANNNKVIILKLIPNRRYFFLCVLFDKNPAKIICIKPDPPTIIAVRKPNITAFPPAFISIEGIIVCTSIKLEASERKIPCQINALKFIFDIFQLRYCSFSSIMEFIAKMFTTLPSRHFAP